MELGARAHAYSVYNETTKTSGYLCYAVMQQDKYVFLAIIITETEATSLDADALLTHFANTVGAWHRLTSLEPAN